MAEITSGRTRRMLSVGRLTTAVGGSYLWQAIKRPFQSVSRTEQALLEAHIRNAERVVARSKELRGAFMKLVQMLSMRSDLFPPEALEVLSVVQSSVPAMPYARVQEVLRAELGAPPEERFRDFEPTAFAAASLGQVHRAVLASGEPDWIANLSAATRFTRRKVASESGLKSALAFPLLIGQEVAGVMEFYSTQRERRDEDMLEVMAHVGGSWAGYSNASGREKKLSAHLRCRSTRWRCSALMAAGSA